MLLRRIALKSKSCLRPVIYLKLRLPMVGTPHIPKFENEHQLGHIHGTSVVERIDLGVYRMLFLGVVGQDDDSASSIFGRENVHK